jgi:hypothetical protein
MRLSGRPRTNNLLNRGAAFLLSVGLCVLTQLIFAQAGNSAPIPEFFGIYAVDGANMFALIEGRAATSPRTKEVEIYSFKTGSSEKYTAYSFSAEVRFLAFSQGARDVQRALSLYRLPWGRNRIDGNPDPYGGRPRQGGINQHLAVRVRGFEVALPAKPVPGQPQMIELVPGRLASGIYALLYTLDRNWTWIFFIVGEQLAASSSDCIDVYFTSRGFGGQIEMTDYVMRHGPAGLLELTSEHYKVCGSLAAPAPTDTPVSPGATAQDSAKIDPNRPSGPAAKPSLDVLTRDVANAAYFKEQTRRFDRSRDVIWTAAKRMLEKSDPLKFKLSADRIQSENREAGTITTAATVHKRLLGGAFRRQYFIIIQSEGIQGSTVAVKGFCYDQRGSRWSPWAPPEKCSAGFLKDLEEELGKQPAAPAATATTANDKAVKCASLLDKKYSVALSGRSYRAMAIPPGTIRQARLFFNDGQPNREATTSAELAEAAFAYETVILSPGARSASQRVRGHIETYDAMKQYEVAQSALARASVAAVLATVSGGSLAVKAIGVTGRIVKEQILSPKMILGATARLALEEAARRYEEVESVLASTRTAEVEAGVGKRTGQTYRVGRSLELMYSPLLSALNPKTGRELIDQALTSAGDEALKALPLGTEEGATLEFIWKLNKLVMETLSREPAFGAYAAGFDLGARLNLSEQETIREWARLAAAGCIKD